MRLKKHRLLLLRTLIRGAATGRCLTSTEAAASSGIDASQARKSLKEMVADGYVKEYSGLYSPAWTMTEELVTRYGAPNLELKRSRYKSRKSLDKKALAAAVKLRYSCSAQQVADMLGVSLSTVTHRLPSRKRRNK